MLVIVVAACGAGTRTAPASPVAGAASCTPFAQVDGSTFESIGLGNPVVVNPSTGTRSVVYFRLCKNRYEYRYIARGSHPHPAKSHASVIHSRTTSSTSSGPRTFTT
jgi:hypothetical protein